MPEISASDGARLHYELHGAGKTHLILLHGLGGSAAFWRPLLDQLDPLAFRALAPDLRGHAGSRGGESAFTFPQLSSDLWRMADAAGIHETVIVGFSGGCKNAVASAASAPDRARGLVLLAPIGMAEAPMPRETSTWLLDYIAREKDIPPQFDPWFTGTADQRAVVARGLVGTPPPVLAASLELWNYGSVVDDASRITQPTLVVAGAREPLYHPAYQRETTLVSLPHARMEVLDCAHYLPLEVPARVAEALSRFCSTLA